MKILGAKFVLEANENIPYLCDMQNIAIDYGDKAIKAMQLGNALSHKDLNFIPIISANAGSHGVMKQECFQFIENYIIQAIKDNLHDLDGLYLHLHGASYVENIGSGDFHILKEIRKVVGPYLPIVVACDPHGNLTKKYVENLQLIRSYRESPHTDIEQTNEFVFNQLVDLIENRQDIHAIYRKLPLILGGEQSVSADEPVVSLNKYMNEFEKDDRVRSISWHVGYIRHDCPEAGASIVVVPQTSNDIEYCEEVADKVSDYIWNKRHEFHYTGCTAPLEQAMDMALASENKPNFITDSGDNVTSGATGCNTFVLRQFLELKDLNKRVLFASIHDDNAYNLLNALEIGKKTTISIGANHDELSSPVSLDVIVKAKGSQQGTSMFGEVGNKGYGDCILVSVDNKPIDIIVANSNHPFVELQQGLVVGADWMDYDITIVKCGYAFPELNKDGHVVVMALTNGATLQDTSKLPFKLIKRPMYPIDNI